MLRKIENILNYTVRFNRVDRVIFYELLANQVEVGVELFKIFKMLSEELLVSDAITSISNDVKQALAEGRPLGDGLEESNFFPEDELGLLRIADGDIKLLPAVLVELRRVSSENVSFFGHVIAPNLYQILVLGFLLGIGSYFEKMGSIIGSLGDVTTNDAYLLSLKINTYGLPVVFLIGFFSVLIFYVQNHGYGSYRRYFLFFNRDGLLKYGGRFCFFASILSSLGQANTSIVSSARHIFRGSGFMSTGLNQLANYYDGTGMNFSEALGKTILGRDIAKLLGAMTVGGDRDLESKAFRSIANIQDIMRKKSYMALQFSVQFSVMGLSAYIIVTLMSGFYSIFSL